MEKYDISDYDKFVIDSPFPVLPPVPPEVAEVPPEVPVNEK
jgi:hypothetical protein